MSARVEGHQARLLSLNDRADELRSTLEAARARAEALHTPEELLSKIAAKDSATRLALKAAIARRVAKIEVHFNRPSSRVTRVTFKNGAKRWILGSHAYDPDQILAPLREWKPEEVTRSGRGFTFVSRAE
jgi:hypothetical protein